MSFVQTVISTYVQFFGSPGLLAIVLIGFLTIILLASRAGKTVTALVLMPLILTFGASVSGGVGVAHWVSISVWLVIGFVFFGMWSVILR